MRFPELAFYPIFGLSECFGVFNLKGSMHFCYLTLLHQWKNTSVLHCKLLWYLVWNTGNQQHLQPNHTVKAGLVQQHHPPTWAGLMLVASARARVLILQVKPLLILQVFPRRASLGAPHTPEDPKGFSGSALAQSNNPFWGPAVEMPGGRKAHLLCLKSVFLAKMCCIFSEKLYSCHSSGYFSFCNNRESHNFRSLKEAASAFAHPYMVQASPNFMETLNSLVLFNLLVSAMESRGLWIKLQDFPSLSQCPKLSVPLISAITAHPNCFNLAVTSLMPLLPPDLLVFPFTDVLSGFLSTSRLIKALILWGSNFLLHVALTNPYTRHFWPQSLLHSWNSSLHLPSPQHNFLSSPTWLTYL